MVWDTGHAAVHKNQNFTHLDDQFDQNMFVLRNIDIRIDSTDLVYIEYYAGYESALYWWRKMVWHFLQPQHWCSVHSKHRDFTNLPDDQFDQYMFILRISIFEMPAMLLWTSNNMLDRNRPYISGGRWFGILVAATALMISPQASENFTHPDASIDQYIFVLKNIDIVHDDFDLVYIENFAW